MGALTAAFAPGTLSEGELEALAVHPVVARVGARASESAVNPNPRLRLRVFFFRFVIKISRRRP
jgi:hypothetical protein